MNKVILTGRLTKEPEVKRTANNKVVMTFSLAVDRHDKDKNTDFPSCVAWGTTADLIAKYCHKGDKIGIEGSIRTRSYDGNNGKVYVTEVLVDNVEFLSDRKQTEQTASDEYEDMF